MTAPFDYPASKQQRRHGPQGYANYASYRPWLRDEFSFRCVYCLFREQWCRHAKLSVDHFLAVLYDPSALTDYENLLYCCPTCNSAKGCRLVPDPTSSLTNEVVVVDEDGTIHATSDEARRLIELLGLDSSQSTEFRLLWIGIVALASRHDAALYQRLMGFPDDLPDLERLRPPGGNLREQGIEDSSFARRVQGTLPQTY